MRYLVLILLIPLVLSAQVATAGRGGNPPGAGGAAAAPPPTPAADLATIEGQVFNALGGTPLRKATITLNRQNSGPMPSGARTNYAATTDASGRYSITGVEPGAYRVNANHTGFLSMQYNARRPEGPGTALDLGSAQKMTGVDFRLTPHGVVSGKITDEDGDPVEGVQVQIMRLVYNQGKKQLQQNNSESTNDLGEYRMSGITPGKYYLCAMYRNRRPMMAGFGGVGDEPASQEDYVTTFFPNATDISAAAPIEMGPGDQVQGINIRLNKTHTVRITGRVMDNTSPPPPAPPPDAGRGGAANIVTNINGVVMNVVNQNANPRIQLRLQPRNSLNPNGLVTNTQVKLDGTFEFPSVAPGPYYLIVVNNSGGRSGAHATRQPIDVGTTNIEGVNLSLNPGAMVSGHVRFDADPPQPPPSLTVRLTPREPTAGIPAPQAAKVDPDGSFRFDDVNLEHYNVTINTPQGLYLKAMRAGDSDAMVAGVDLTAGAASLDILLGTNPPVVGGQVMNSATQQPAAAVTVVLMPREKERQGEIYFYSTTNSDQYGNFSFTRVTPGEYQVYAWEDVQYGQWFDPEWMKSYEGKGESLTAKEGSPVNVKLTMIPAK
jgi:protocatechuate 3,4-dioxygenase beta subunit